MNPNDPYTQRVLMRGALLAALALAALSWGIDYVRGMPSSAAPHASGQPMNEIRR